MGRVLWFLLGVLIVAVLIPQPVYASKKEDLGGIQRMSYVPGELLVKFKNGMGALSSEYVHHLTGARVLDHFKFVKGLEHIQLPSSDIQEALSYYNSHPLIEYAEPNYIYSIYGAADDVPLPDDPKFGELWGLHNTGQPDPTGLSGSYDADIDAPEAWTTTTGSPNIVVAVIDTGIDYKHEDLAANMWVNTGEIPGNGIDDDKNDYIDDVYGYDFSNKDGDPLDDHEHGTHVAGTIAAIKDNKIGVAGVAPTVKLMAVKFLDSFGSGELSNAALGIEYAIAMGAKILSNSWGGFSQTLYDIIAHANQNKVVFTAAAGNDGKNTDGFPHYPSSYQQPNVISVGAITNEDILAGFSNYGIKSVHLLAPGQAILSAIPGNNYDVMRGTSMATPHVSGIAALLLSQEPELSPEEVRDRLIKTSDEILSVRRKVMSAGRVNAYNALHDIIPPKAGPKDPGDWIDVAHAISTPHNYPNNTDQTWTIRHPGATLLKIYFSKFDTEGGYDIVRITNKSGVEYDNVDGSMGAFWSFIVEGDTANIQFKSDANVNRYGFDIEKYAYSTTAP
ncbi:MAG: S8 family serine peptidase [Deltaproteobacteria bacterium]